MHILIGLAMAAALLYFWLLGHWFARVLVFLTLLVCAGLLALVIGGGNAPGSTSGGLVVFIVGAGVGWPVASIPINYLRRRMAAAEAADKQLTRETVERFNERNRLNG